MSSDFGRDGPSENPPLHVFDLPQVHSKPSFSSLRDALLLLSLGPAEFDSTAQKQVQRVLPEGVPKYLTNILASSLSWMEDDDSRESIWTLAARCITERSGRTAMGDLTRSFALPGQPSERKIVIHEPGLTGDNLGLKTWASSFVLARRIKQIDLPGLENSDDSQKQPRILELGSGTGLLGLVAAATLQKHVILTDLPEIQDNLQHNIQANTDLLSELGGSAECATLDWQEPRDMVLDEERGGNGESVKEKAMIILVADPIYSPEHPRLLVNAVVAWMHPSANARAVIGYPLRNTYGEQIEELRGLLHAAGLVLVNEVTCSANDDWDQEVQCCCTVWRWA